MLKDAIFFGIGFVTFPVLYFGRSYAWDAIKKVGYMVWDMIRGLVSK